MLLLLDDFFQSLFMCKTCTYTHKLNMIFKRSSNSYGQVTILPISTKQTINSPLKTLITNKKRKRHVLLKIQVLAWDRHKNVAVLNQ